MEQYFYKIILIFNLLIPIKVHLLINLLYFVYTRQYDCPSYFIVESIPVNVSDVRANQV